VTRIFGPVPRVASSGSGNYIIRVTTIMPGPLINDLQAMGKRMRERIEVILSTLKSPTRSRRPEGTSLVAGTTLLPSLHRQNPLAAVLLFPHSTSPCLSSPSISSPPLLGTIGSTAKTFSCNSSTRSPTSSTSVRNQKRSYLRLGDCAWSCWASYELLTECMFRTCSEPVSPA